MTQTPTAPDRTGATAPDDLALAIPGTTVRGRAARVLPQDRPDTTSWAPRTAESRAATSRSPPPPRRRDCRASSGARRCARPAPPT